MSDPANILVVGPSWVGDMVMAQALFRRLCDRYPAAAIDVVAPAWSLPLLERMPEVHAGVELALGHGEFGLAARRRLGRRLRDRHYDWAIVLPRSFKAALVPAFARIPRRTGFRGEYRYGLLTEIRPFDPQRLDQTVKRFLALGLEDETLEDIPYPQLQIDAALARAHRERLGLKPDGSHIALAPGAEYGPAKRWPAENFAALARACTQRGADVLLIGSAKEADTGEEIVRRAAASRVVNLCGRTELTEAVDLLGSARAVVCNDSGLMHVAAAAGAPLIAIYGSSSPQFTPPLTHRAKVIWESLPCSPCFQRECPLGHLDCLRRIEPARVMRELEALLAAHAAA